MSPIPDALESEEDFRQYVRELCKQTSQTAVADEVGVRPSQVNQIISGRASIGSKMADRFGFEKVKSIRFIRKRKR